MKIDELEIKPKCKVLAKVAFYDDVNRNALYL
jgi:hypothetical protein